MINADIVSDVDFGPEYFRRIALTSAKQKFRKVVNGILWMNRVRKNCIMNALMREEEEMAILRER